jgi:upstream activation factor subunit UAF30
LFAEFNTGITALDLAQLRKLTPRTNAVGSDAVGCKLASAAARVTTHSEAHFVARTVRPIARRKRPHPAKEEHGRAKPDAQGALGIDLEVVKKMWQYIKRNRLQDAVNKRMINADEKLKGIFGKAQVSMFEMTKLINQHLK